MLVRNGVDEAVHDVDGDDLGPAGGVLEHSPTPDRGQLVPVADQRDPHAVFVGDHQQCVGGVLVQHAGLVHQQQVPRLQAQPRTRPGVAAAGLRVGVTGPRPVQVPCWSQRQPWA